MAKNIQMGTLGAVAYDAYASRRQKTTGHQMPFWEDLPAVEKLAWLDAALAVWKKQYKESIQ